MNQCIVQDSCGLIHIWSSSEYFLSLFSSVMELYGSEEEHILCFAFTENAC